jgi:ATP-dependent exoDNAse (exonuclease V) alpha subunit
MCCSSQNQLIEAVYDNLSPDLPVPTPEYFRDRAILSPRNDDVRALNQNILELLPGDVRSFQSADSYSIESPSMIENRDIPVEFLHTLNASGLPVSNLQLKLGCPILILRNIDTKRGLCNGTRATIRNMSNRLLEVKLLNGDHAGEIALIPRITLSPSLTGNESIIKLNHRQFPVQLALAMTINKAQGQTVQRVGVDLRKPVITQLSAVCANEAEYEAAGCVGSLRSLGKSRGSYVRCPDNTAIAHRSAEYGNR